MRRGLAAPGNSAPQLTDARRPPCFTRSNFIPFWAIALALEPMAASDDQYDEPLGDPAKRLVLASDS
jgi:hypothetical protein